MKHGNENPEAIYKECIKTIDLHIKKYRKKHTVLAILKLFLFFGGIFLLIKIFSKDSELALTIFGSFFILFVMAALLHETILKRMNHYKTLKRINENEIKSLSHQFSTTLNSGTEFMNSEHGYTSDLDIFGDKSLFHYINRTVTSIGRKRLAEWLQSAVEVEEIEKRQEAVNELTGKLHFRQNLQAHGMAIDDTSQKLESLHRLFDEPFFMKDKKILFYFIHLFPFITVTLLVLIFFEWPLLLALAPVFIQLAINKGFEKKVSRLYRLASRNSKILKAYSDIIREIENESFDNIKLDRLKKALYQKEKKASFYIKRLATLMEWFDIRSGSLHPLVNNILFWDLHCVYRIEKWKQETASVIHQWFNVIGNFEALSSFANVYFNNPRWILPEIYKEGFRLKAESIGHPLIPQKERVCNDITLKQEGSILIVTGPNMAGKSTFLRTIGVNVVLALAGAPVCADVFEISPLKLFTSMETSDSLDKHLSLFYAELQRLKMILDGISNKEPLFFLIDEMLKGTNALDRQKGSIALIKQLLRRHSNGIVATHDLELTKLEAEEEKIINYHFDGYIKKEKLLFDYKLKRGICESFNALVLMKKIGIEL
jgi:ABC-type multidrug transport system fused ATPase/permease subunit